jgi:hypothetical protein
MRRSFLPRSPHLPTLQMNNPVDQVIQNAQLNADGSVNAARLAPKNVWSGNRRAAESNYAAAASVPVLVRNAIAGTAVDVSTRSTDWVSNCYTARP